MKNAGEILREIGRKIGKLVDTREYKVFADILEIEELNFQEILEGKVEYPKRIIEAIISSIHRQAEVDVLCNYRRGPWIADFILKNRTLDTLDNEKYLGYIEKELQEIKELHMQAQEKFKSNGENIVDLIEIRIKEKREQLGLSQQELAQRAKITQSYLSKIETGWADPSRKTLEKIAQGLGDFTLRELLEGTNYKDYYKEEIALKGPISFCPNKDCPEAVYIKKREEHEYSQLIFVKYARFPVIEDTGRKTLFCPYCGTKLLSSCQCGAPIESDKQRFCPLCGKENFPGEIKIEDYSKIEREGSLRILRA